MNENSVYTDSTPVKSSKWKYLSFILIVIIVAQTGLLVYNYWGYDSRFSSLQTQLTGLQQQVESYNSLYANVIDAEYQVIPENVSLAQLYEAVQDSIVMIQGLIVQTTWRGQQITGTVQGSGFVYNYTGRMVVITNFHVIEGTSSITVEFNNGNAYLAETLGSDKYSDLAVLSVNAPVSEFHPLQIVRSSTLRVGDYVIAIGNPYGLVGSMTTGIVSALGRTITESTSNFAIANVIQTSAPINSGNSGGPLLNEYGQVVGITTAIVEGSTGVGFAIPSNTILREIDALVNASSYTMHPYLGISGTDMTYGIAQEMGVDVTYGVLITQVTSGGPASTAGLKGYARIVSIDGNSVYVGGDIIIAIDGILIEDMDSLLTYLEEHTLPNQTISLTIIRNGISTTVSLLLGTRP
ncbi:MAG: Trypsin [Thermoproteota archaeon]|nr:Trypsin [Thermoproteota archaeon]